MKPIRVLLVDDHSLVRKGLRSVLKSRANIEIMGEAADGESAVAMAGSLQPDVVIMDLTMPGLGGLEALRRIREECRGTRVLILTMHDGADHLREVLRAGASGYVTKTAVAEDLPAAVEAVASGSLFVDPAMAEKLAREVLSGGEAPDASLSRRESQVARLAAMGHTNREISEVLEVSVKTVETYRSRLMEKLNLRTRAELVRYALERGWLASS